ncbi:hypothetical protein N5F13_00380 [Comamonas thiooxydans]|uniref:hypothetical protein n=1 Tax=Comamonas thiooxydans TaxID=363952 RepID=UPI00244B98F9|nr:hypothetical protein [Comamonas thiooxydans]MDH1472937.1 hypothetical protein [Comamonas thiooxydans]
MPNFVALKKYEVTYRNQHGIQTPKKANVIGADDRAVRAQYEAKGFKVLSVVYQGFAGGTVRVD